MQYKEIRGAVNYRRNIQSKEGVPTGQLFEDRQAQHLCLYTSVTSQSQRYDRMIRYLGGRKEGAALMRSRIPPIRRTVHKCSPWSTSTLSDYRFVLYEQGISFVKVRKLTREGKPSRDKHGSRQISPNVGQHRRRPSYHKTPSYTLRHNTFSHAYK